MRLTNAFICAARSAYYALTEPVKLRWLRLTNEPKYWPPLFLWATGDKWEPLVSVYVPSHNRAALLIERALKSILAQTYTNLEIIVVADNCNRDALNYIADFCDHDKRLKLIDHRGPKSFPHKAENYWFAGRVDPSNVGLEHCKGSWIATVDDDDVWLPMHLEHLLRFAQHGDYEFVSSGSVVRGGRKIAPYEVNGVLIGGIQTWFYRSYLKTFKFNRQCFRKRWNKVCDTELQDRFVKAGVRMGYFPETTAEIVARPGETKIGLKAYMADAEKTEKHFAF